MYKKDCIKMERKYKKFSLNGELKQVGGRVKGAKNKIHKIGSEYGN